MDPATALTETFYNHSQNDNNKLDGVIVSNEDFINTIFNGLPEGISTAICTKPGDPGNGGWFAQNGNNVTTKCLPQNNNYFNCSSFRVGGNEDVQARKENFHAYHAILLDDVGTKVSREALGGLKASWDIETSPGNHQVGIILDPPLTDAAQVKALQDAIIAKDLCDPGANGAARWARLPNAINGKEKYRTNGQPFRCKLTAWNPDVRMSMDELVKALDLNLAPRPLTIANQAVTTHLAPAEEGSSVYAPAPVTNPVIAALMAKSMYKKALGEGRHDISCPKVEDHTDQLDDGTVYFEPSRAFPMGGAKCFHKHGRDFSIMKLLNFLDVHPIDARCTPQIALVPGLQYLIVEAGVKALARNENVYQTGGALTSLRTDTISSKLTPTVIDETALGSLLSEAASWITFDGKQKERRLTNPPERIVRAIMKSPNYANIRLLNGVAHQPFFRSDGSIVTNPGYDQKTGIYADFDGNDFPIEANPSREDAEKALVELIGLLEEFPFASAEDKSAALAAMLTAAVRSTLSLAPAFNLTASDAGSGKSYLASIIARFNTPMHPIMATYPANKEEAEKSMLAHGLDSNAPIIFDDMQGDWYPFGTMNKILTSEWISGRILGQSKTVSVSTKRLVIGTGNNSAPIADMCRRVVTCRLSADCANPALRTFKGNPEDVVREKRNHFVTLALTIIMAYRKAGSPKANAPSIATYGQWSDMCRQPLLWLGLADPASSLISQLKSDPDKEDFGVVLARWHDLHGDKPMLLRKLLEFDMSNQANELEYAISDLPVMERGNINHHKLGWLFRRRAGQQVNGYKLEKADHSERNAWRVVKVEPKPAAN